MAERVVWDESMVREGCICRHGQYNHATSGWLNPGPCLVPDCGCRRFSRDMSGDRCGGGCVLVWKHEGEHSYA